MPLQAERFHADDAYVVLRTKPWLRSDSNVPLPGDPKELIQFIDLDGPQTFDSVARLGPPLSAAIEEIGVDIELLRSYQDEYMCRYLLKQLMQVGVAEAPNSVAGTATDHKLRFPTLLSELVQ